MIASTKGHSLARYLSIGPFDVFIALHFSPCLQELLLPIQNRPNFLNLFPSSDSAEMKILQVMAFLLGAALAHGPGSGNPGNGGNDPDPNNAGTGSGPLCPAGLYGQPQCCGTDQLGLLDLDCKHPSSPPSNVADFKSICAKSGKAAKCCVLPYVSRVYIQFLMPYYLCLINSYRVVEMYCAKMLFKRKGNYDVNTTQQASMNQ